jgi:ribose transport system substrate-binding protein
LAKAIGGKGEVGALYFANNFHVTNLRYIGFIARLEAKYPNVKLVTTAGFDNPDKGQQVSQAMFARYPNLKGLYGAWSIPAMGVATSAKLAGRTPENFKIVCGNFDQIVTANMAKNGFIAGISAQQPYKQAVAEATMGALSLIGVKVPVYAVVPPLAVTRDNLAQQYQKEYRKPLPKKDREALKSD